MSTIKGDEAQTSHVPRSETKPTPKVSAAPSFTPGPWKLETVPTQVGHCHKIGPFPSRNSRRPETYACVYVDGLGLKPEGSPELLANARLIAAAPQLYEALNNLLLWKQHSFTDTPPYGHDCRWCVRCVSRVASDAHAALALANPSTQDTASPEASNSTTEPDLSKAS